MSIEKEMKQIGRNRKEELSELYARIEVLERNLKAFKNYVKYNQDADDCVKMGNGRCSYEARQLENQMSMILNASYNIDSKTFAMEVLTSAKAEA
jgi:hypothetical protein